MPCGPLPRIFSPAVAFFRVKVSRQPGPMGESLVHSCRRLTWEQHHPVMYMFVYYCLQLRRRYNTRMLFQRTRLVWRPLHSTPWLALSSSISCLVTFTWSMLLVAMCMRICSRATASVIFAAPSDTTPVHVISIDLLNNRIPSFVGSETIAYASPPAHCCLSWIFLARALRAFAAPRGSSAPQNGQSCYTRFQIQKKPSPSSQFS